MPPRNGPPLPDRDAPGRAGDPMTGPGSGAVVTPPARLSLPGHEPTEVRAAVIYRSTSLRLTRAMIYLIGLWALAPLVFLIPPHLPWALAAVVAGIALAWSNWSGTWEVRSVEGACPRCGTRLTVKPGARISLPHDLSCFHCHHNPTLELGRPPE